MNKIHANLSNIHNVSNCLTKEEIGKIMQKCKYEICNDLTLNIKFISRVRHDVLYFLECEARVEF